MKKIFLTGHNGQLGKALTTLLKPFGEIVTLDREKFDLAQPGTIAKQIREVRPDIIINAAAYTNVDKAETEPEIAMMVNGIAPGIIAAEAKNLNALLIHYSTDYVFDGRAESPYEENASTNPLNTYGKTKLEGEHAIQNVAGNYLIFRTSWVYSMHGRNFLLTMLKLAKEKSELKIIDDQVGTPNWSGFLAIATGHILKQYHEAIPSGIYNLTSGGQTSWYGFAQAIFNQSIAVGILEKAPVLIPISSQEYSSKVDRPKFSVLSTKKTRETFQLELDDWREGLQQCLSLQDKGQRTFNRI